MSCSQVAAPSRHVPARSARSTSACLFSLILVRALPQVVGYTWVYHSMAALRRRQPSLVADYDAGARRRARPQPRKAS